MEEFELIKNYFQKLTKNSIGSLKLNDDVFFYKTKTRCRRSCPYPLTRRHLHKRGAFAPNMRSRDWRLLIIPMAEYTSLDS